MLCSQRGSVLTITKGGKKIHTVYFLQTAHRYGTVGSHSECLTDKMFWKRNFQRWYEIKCVILLFPTEDTDSEL